MNGKFSFQPTIQGEAISIRPLKESDFDEYYSCASDKKIWEGHPHPGRYKLSEFTPYFRAAIDSNAFVVVTENTSGKIIGASKYYLLDSVPDDISIGFTFLVRKYWGGETNRELKGLMLNYAFRYFDTVWFHIGPTNIRSQKATEKIGAVFSHKGILDISGKDETWLCYQISRDKWQMT
jgi:RimJ/RimL family protein N-acetyltransferase